MISRWPTMNDVPIYIVNLRRSVARRRHMKRQFVGTGHRPTVLRGFDCHAPGFPFPRYKDLFGPWWNRQHSFKPGAFGCYLSHAKAWREVAFGCSPIGVVLEDDVLVNKVDFDKCLEDLAGLRFDVVFINQRMHDWLRLPGRPPEPSQPLLHGVASLLYDFCLSGIFRDGVRCPGTDGYVVSKKGALKLLYMMQSRKIRVGVDYAMVLNTLTDDHLETLNGMSADLPSGMRWWLHTELRDWKREGPIRLDNYIYSPPRHGVVQLDPKLSSVSTIGKKMYLPNEVFGV